MEIVDLESSAAQCNNLTDLPSLGYPAVGGLGFNDNPLICDHKSCFSMENSAWQASFSFNEVRNYAAMCLSPFPRESSA